MKKMRIILSAYACEPWKGSEPAVGWEWSRRLASRYEVLVLTRANNREVIEKFLSGVTEPVPQFLYFDPPDWIVRLKRNGVMPVSLFYLIWQLLAVRHAKASGFEADIVHHVTFNGFRFPGAWWNVPWKVVLGPLGGASIASHHYARCFGRRWPLEYLRGLTVKLGQWNPWTWLSFRRADALLFVTDEMCRRFGRTEGLCEPLLETAVPDQILTVESESKDAPRNGFLWVGMIEGWKGWELAFEAFAAAFADDKFAPTLRLVGLGRDKDRAEKRALELGIDSHVKFLGKLNREEVWAEMGLSKGLFFSSIRDTSGNVVLEAMAMRCPVICLNHQGSAVMTDDTCAMRVKPGSWNATVKGFAEALRILEKDTELVQTMGEAGRQRVESHFTWDRKIEVMEGIYEQGMSKQ